MAYDVQVAIDCSSPHELADWWAEALGWQVEAQDEAFIRRMVEQGAASDEDTTEHRGALVWRQGAAITSPEPGRPRVLFQQVPEPKAGKNRLHFDLDVPDIHAAGERARELGATPAGPPMGDDPDSPFQVWHDPEGNEFCFVTAEPSMTVASRRTPSARSDSEDAVA